VRSPLASRREKNQRPGSETPNFNYGVPDTRHPTPYTLFILPLAQVLTIVNCDSGRTRCPVITIFTPRVGARVTPRRRGVSG
jgi:hypothetical protein